MARSTIMLEFKVGDRVKSREDGMTGTVMRREHDFEHPRYVIAWDDGEQDLAERRSRFGGTLTARAGRGQRLKLK
jgi:hypothetical protein